MHVLESASTASFKTPATFIDSIRQNNSPEKTEESRNQIQLARNHIALSWPKYMELRAKGG